MKTNRNTSGKSLQVSAIALLNMVLFFSANEKATAQTGAGILGIDHVGINVPNLNEAVTFFTDVLGFTPVTQLGPLPLDAAWKEQNHISPATSAVTIKMINAGTGASIEVFEYADNQGNKKQPGADDAGASHIAFYTKDIHTAVKYLKSKGVKIIGEPFLMPSGDTAGETWVYFETPWGTKMELVSYPDGKGYEKNNPKTVLWSPKNIGVKTAPDAVSLDADKNRLLVKRHFELWNETDPAKRSEILNAIYAHDIEMVDRNFIANGNEQINTFIAELQQKNPKGKFSVKAMETNHNIIRVYWQNGTPSKPDAVTGMDLFVVENGKVQKLYVFVDNRK
nr:VOC family protein [uncultured Flavobacterium sp.]